MSFDQERINALSSLFQRAEKSVKKAEHIDDGIIIPSINELRYFGYHILIAMQNENNREEVLSEFKKAEGHAKRAIYDASEAIVLFYLEKAFKFQNDFGSSPHITDVIPDYIELQKKLHSAKKQIDELRKSNVTAYNQRDQFYEECEPHIEALGSVIQTFDLASPEIAKKDRKYATNRRFTILGIGVTFVLGIWGLAFNLFSTT